MPFAGVQEPLQAQWIQDIVAHRHWLIARDYYGLINLKPPLYFWLSALVVKYTGGHVTEPLSRVVSLIAGAALATEVLLWTRAKIGRFAGWFAYGVLLGSYGFASFATVNITDMLMSFLLFSAYCVIYPAVAEIGSPKRVGIAGILLGLAILTKGPIALLLCTVAIALFVVLRIQSPFAILRQPWPWQLLLIAFLVAAPWYIAAAAEYGKEFTSVIVAENLGHAFAVASTAGTGAPHGWTFIPLRLLRAALPGVFLLIPLGAAALWGCIKESACKPLGFHLAMVLAVLLLFSPAHSVESYYVLPAVPSLAIVISGVFAIRAEPADTKQKVIVRFRNLMLVGITVTLLLLVLGSWVCITHGFGLSAVRLRPNSDDWLLARLYCQGMNHPHGQFLLLMMSVGLGAALSVAALSLRRDIYIAAGAVLAAIAGTGFWTGTMRTQLYAARTTKPFVAAIRERTADVPVYTVTQDYELGFYYGYALPLLRRPPVPDMFGRGDLRPRLLEPRSDTSSPMYVILRRNEQFYLRAARRIRLRLALTAGSAVSRNPALFLIASAWSPS